jgi:hypothetical protein
MAPNLTFKNLTINTSKRETVHHEGGGVTHRAVPDGTLVGDIEVYIDHAMLKRMAERALRARSRKAVVGSGVVICKARNVRKGQE